MIFAAQRSIGTGRASRRDRLEQKLMRAVEVVTRLQAALDREESASTTRSLDSQQFQGAGEIRGKDLHDASRPGSALIDEREAADPAQATEAEAPPDLKTFLRRIINEADHGRELPSPRQVALSFLAFAYVIGIPCLETYTLQAISADLGCSYSAFYRAVARWSNALSLPIPHAKGRRMKGSVNNPA